MIRIPFSPYDKLRLGVPWAGIVYEWHLYEWHLVLPKNGLRPPNDMSMFGEWRGTAREGGHVHLLRRSLSQKFPGIKVNADIGTVFRWGQRNRATGRTVNEGYGIVLSPSTYQVIDREMAWRWHITRKMRNP